MNNIKEIRGHIKSVRDTMKVTNAMYLIASSRMRSAKPRLRAASAYQKNLRAMLSGLNAGEEDIPWNGTLWVCLTADKGMSGDFTPNAVAEAVKKRREEEGELLIIGQAGRKYMLGHHLSFNESFGEALPEPGKEEALWEALNKVRGERRLMLVYTSFHEGKSLGCETIQLWPPVFEKTKLSETEFYPDRETVKDCLMSDFGLLQLKMAVLDNYTSEQQSRMMAMKTAGDNAKELLDSLTLEYNHMRQNAITREITEMAGERGISEE